MNLDRPTNGTKIASVSASLLFASMFLNWYGYEQDEPTSNLLSYLNLFARHGANAWETLDVIPIVLAVTIAVATGAARLALLGSDWGPPIPRSAAAAVLGAISFLLILYRIVFPPGLPDISHIPFHATPELGIYLALLPALGIAFGGYWTMREEGTSLST